MVDPSEYGTQAELDELAPQHQNDTIIKEVVCFGCKNLLFYPACRAFPVIPYEIRFGYNDHTQNMPGDHGIKYEPLKAPK